MSPKILSQQTADALEILVDKHGYDPALKTTAFFCRKMGRAYDLLASRNRKCALSKSKPEKLAEALEQIDEFYEIVETLKFRCPRYKKGTKYSKSLLMVVFDIFVKLRFKANTHNPVFYTD